MVKIGVGPLKPLNRTVPQDHEIVLLRFRLPAFFRVEVRCLWSVHDSTMPLQESRPARLHARAPALCHATELSDSAEGCRYPIQQLYPCGSRMAGGPVSGYPDASSC